MAKQAKKLEKDMTDTRTLFAETQNGQMRKIVIPVDWVVTFGPIGVGSRNDGNSPNVLRIYSDKSKSSLMGVYRNITSMSDERVAVMEKSVKKKQKIFQRRGNNGEQSYAAEIRKTVWQNPYADEPDVEEDNDFDESILALPEADIQA